MASKDEVIVTFGSDDPPATNVLDEIKSLKPVTASPIDDYEPVILGKKKPKEKKKKKKRKSSLASIGVDLGMIPTEDEIESEDTNGEDDPITIGAFLEKLDERDEDDSAGIVDKQKRGYKKLKKGEDKYKKEFAEEITLLYSLLDETTQYSKELEKDLKGIRSSKVRGVSKYSNDLAALVMTSKQTKLSIIKEIAAVKKSIADLGFKDRKDDNNNKANNSSEALASQYFKNILTHGRTDFIDMVSGSRDDDDDDVSELSRSGFSDREELEYNRILEERLSSTDNPFRSADGSKYIEYENRGVEIRVSRCIDTGEWEFIAVDKTGNRVDDYPLPDKRTAGRMKFSEDSTYARDQLGRMYTVMEYYLPNDEYDDD